MKRFVCLGGMNIDLQAIYYAGNEHKMGRVHYSMGGVARNIAEYITMLGKTTYLVSAYGDDDFGKAIKDHTSKLHINTDYCKVFHGSQTTTYIALYDEKKQLMQSICDNALVEALSDFDIYQAINHFDHQDYYLFDANLSVHQMKMIFNEPKNSVLVPIYRKSLKEYIPIFAQFSMILFNRENLKECTGIHVADNSFYQRIVVELAKLKVQSALLMIDGLCLAYVNKHEMTTCWCEELSNLHTQTANELLISAFLTTLSEHCPIEKALEFALTAMIVDEEIRYEVDRKLDKTKIIERIQRINFKTKKENYNEPKIY